MPIRRTLSLLAVAAIPVQAQPSLADLRLRIAERVGAVPGAVAGVYVKDLRDGRELAWNADSSFHAASTMKVPVMIEYFRGVDAGRFPEGARVTLRNTFASIVDGSSYTLAADDDSDSALYARAGQEVPVRELVERMIIRSSNLATNSVIALVGAGKANATAHALGARSMQVLRGVEDNKAYEAGRSNTTTARDLGMLFEAIAAGRAASPASTREMLEILGAQAFNDEIPAGLPPGTKVAHKTGWITGTLHDAALVQPAARPPFVLVVLTGNIAEQRTARELIRDVARMVWEAIAQTP